MFLGPHFQLLSVPKRVHFTVFVEPWSKEQRLQHILPIFGGK